MLSGREQGTTLFLGAAITVCRRQRRRSRQLLLTLMVPSLNALFQLSGHSLSARLKGGTGRRLAVIEKPQIACWTDDAPTGVRQAQFQLLEGLLAA